MDTDWSWTDDEPSWRTVRRSMLEDGSVLRDMIRRFKAGDEGCSRLAMYSVIRDSEFSVPFEGDMGLSGLDPDDVQAGDTITMERGARLRPASL